MLTQTGVAALIQGYGFPPNSEIDMQLVNGSRSDAGKTRVDEKGTYSATVMPISEGVSEGTIKVNVTSPQCSPSLSFNWSAKPEAGAQSGTAAPAVPPAPKPSAAPNPAPAKGATR